MENNCVFFDLPAEIRAQIYDYVIPASQTAWKKLDKKVKKRPLSLEVAAYRAFHPSCREWYPHLTLTWVSRKVNHEYWMRFYNKCKIVFKSRDQLANFFGWNRQKRSWNPRIPREYINAIRHIGFKVELYTDFLNMFGARISDDYKRIPEWEVVILRHMKELREVTIKFYLMDPGAEESLKWNMQKHVRTSVHVHSDWFDPVLFHSEEPCQKAISDWVLTAAMPFVGHVKKLNLTGCVKPSQIARIESIHEQILKVVSPAPELTNNMMKNAYYARNKATYNYNAVHGRLSDILRPISENWTSTTSTSRVHNYEAYDQFFRGEREIIRKFYLDCSMLDRKQKTDRYWICGLDITDFPFPMIVREEV